MPVHYPHLADEPYRPANGTEGEMFHERFCYRCRRGQDEDNPCPILGATLVFSVVDAGYPKEWKYDNDGRPTCTAFHDVQSKEPAAGTRCPETLDMFNA